MIMTNKIFNCFNGLYYKETQQNKVYEIELKKGENQIKFQFSNLKEREKAIDIIKNFLRGNK